MKSTFFLIREGVKLDLNLQVNLKNDHYCCYG